MVGTTYSPSWWPRGLRRRSAAARLLELGVRIPPGAWVCLLWVFSVVQAGACATGRSLVKRSPTECVCVCVSLSVIRCNNNRQHLQCVGRRGPTKTERKVLLSRIKYFAVFPIFPSSMTAYDNFMPNIYLQLYSDFNWHCLIHQVKTTSSNNGIINQTFSLA
jgi:hypothetical protein